MMGHPAAHLKEEIASLEARTKTLDYPLTTLNIMIEKGFNALMLGKSSTDAIKAVKQLIHSDHFAFHGNVEITSYLDNLIRSNAALLSGDRLVHGLVVEVQPESLRRYLEDQAG